MEKGWRYYRNGAGELVIFCALCTYRAPSPDTQLQPTE